MFEKQGSSEAGAERSPVAGARRWFFDRWSRIYDLPPVQWATCWPIHDAILRELRRVGSCRILDIGCGTGQLAARIVREPPECDVTGCDFSRGMLEHASARNVRMRCDGTTRTVCPRRAVLP